MGLVVAEGLSKSYGHLRAVSDSSLTLNEGSITGLVGPNGAGKTTTIKMILGILKPDKGQVFVFNQNPWTTQTFVKSLELIKRCILFSNF